MPVVSIIMPCYNAGKYLRDSINSVIRQEFTDWELIIVNDGSKDTSLDIALSFQNTDNRIKVVTKENGGYVSARLHGMRFICQESDFLLFYDADDMLHPEMLKKLYTKIAACPAVGAIYCNHSLIDEDGKDLGLPGYGRRIVPTALWMKTLDEDMQYTPFISIFCWTKMIEPMTLLRRKAYDESSGWDIRFGLGQGNIGDGALLFSEIALSWKVMYVNEPLYFYRKHSAQATASNTLNKKAGDKVLSIWQQRIEKNYAFSKDVRAAIICYRRRVAAFTKMGSLKHMLRYTPVRGIALIGSIFYNYLLSLKLLLYRDTSIFKY